MNADRLRRRARRPSREDGDECDQRRREVDDDRARLALGAGPARRRRARGALPARGTCVQHVQYMSSSRSVHTVHCTRTLLF